MKITIKKKFLKILIPSLILLLAVSQTNILANLRRGHSTAEAVGDLNIDWGVTSGQPIFTIENLLPGDIETRTVKITNNASVIRPIGVRGIKTSETAALATVLEIVVQADGVDLYGGISPTGIKTLTEFFTESSGSDGIPLFNLSPGITKFVSFIVYFKPESGNQFQTASVVFDLQIGIAYHLPEECQQIKFSGPPIFGTEGNDSIKGTNKNDLIIGFEGDDRIDGSNGDDCLIGGPGNDRLDGSNGEDQIYGGEGNDLIDAGNGVDLVDAGPGDDTVFGSNGDDRIFGRSGNDKLYGGNGKDYLEGNEGDDRFEGGNGNDTLIGGPGLDWATGDLGVDTCETETRIKCEY